LDTVPWLSSAVTLGVCLKGNKFTVHRQEIDERKKYSPHI
jgi:hypothetical protein